MKGLLAIYRRELQSYFVSPIAYVVIGVFLIASGLVYYFLLNRVIQVGFQMQMQGMRGGMPQDFDMPGQLLRAFIGFVGTYVIPFLIPLLTMGLYSEERKRGTMELLMTSPLSEIQIVMGKFLASLSLFVLMLALTFIYQVATRSFSDPKLPWKIILCAYLGASLLSLGAWVSSLTENQIIAAVVTFVGALLLLLLNVLISDVGSKTGEVLQYLSILNHFDDFAKGVIDTTSLVYYLTVIALGLFLTLRTLDSMRWRRA